MTRIIKLPAAVVHPLQESSTFPLGMSRGVDGLVHYIFAERLRVHRLARIPNDDDIARQQLLPPQREEGREGLLRGEVAVGAEEDY
jgi:hypothetical protein